MSNQLWNHPVHKELDAASPSLVGTEEPLKVTPVRISNVVTSICQLNSRIEEHLLR
jgi:hypothetical protein